MIVPALYRSAGKYAAVNADKTVNSLPYLLTVPHRGVHILDAAPDNSLDSLRLAKTYGFNIVECDVETTLDGQFVLSHDATLNNMFRYKAGYASLGATDLFVKDYTLQQLKDDFVFKSVNVNMRRPIVELMEFVKACKYYGLTPLIELRSSKTEAQVQTIVNTTISTMGYGCVIWQSFSATILDYVRKYDKRSLVYQLASSPSFSMATVAALKKIAPAVYFANGASLTESIVSQYKQNGIRIVAYGTTADKLNYLLSIGIDEICTDFNAALLDRAALIQESNDFVDWTLIGTTSGSVYGDYLLKAGEKLTITGANVKYGAYYLMLELLSGSAKVVGTNLAETTITTNYRAQPMTYNTDVTLSIEAITDCVLHSVYFARTAYK